MISDMEGVRWWEVELVKVRRRADGFWELDKTRRVSMMDELLCMDLTAAQAKLSIQFCVAWLGVWTEVFCSSVLEGSQGFNWSEAGLSFSN